jgi:serine O-acetyltransferase
MGVTIGERSKLKEVPNLGKNVYVVSGAKVLGNITIGDNCIIGANAVVISGVSSNCALAAIPGKVIKTNVNASDYY